MRAEKQMPAHTPGPWVADDLCMQDDAVVRVGTTDCTPTYYHRSKTICECWVREDKDDEDAPHILQAEANARLIAAAPDLLAACKASWALGHKVYHNANAHEATPDWAEVRRLLGIAIAKAEGRRES